ncbi:hypothetical protein VPH35_123221 [Triticum aestivum]
MFSNPCNGAVTCLLAILESFGEATGLRVNPSKSIVEPIQCQALNQDDIVHHFAGRHVGFPISYMGLPISLGRLRKVHLQFIFHRIKAKLAGWKGRLMNSAGRRTLVRLVQSAIPIFMLTSIKASSGVLKETDKICRRILWAQEDELSGGKCKVNWRTVCSPLEFGGLGLLDTAKFARALRLRWLWLSWDEVTKPWAGFLLPCDDQDRQLFAAATSVTIGNGERATFLESTWLGPLPL